MREIKISTDEDVGQGSGRLDNDADNFSIAGRNYFSSCGFCDVVIVVALFVFAVSTIDEAMRR